MSLIQKFGMPEAYLFIITFLVFFISNMSMNCLDPRIFQARITGS